MIKLKDILTEKFEIDLEVGDTILEINEKKISDFSQLRLMISSNESIKVTFSRNDKIIVTNIKTVDGKIGIKGTIETRKLNIHHGF